jgi:hypothetical protein
LGPVEHAEFTGLGGSVGRIEAGAGEIEDAREGEVVADHIGEEASMGLGGVRARSEIGNGDAGLFDAEPSASTEPVLGDGWWGKEEESEETKEKQRRKESHAIE